MSLVTLVSGGLDSTLMAILAKEEKLKQWPLFIDYGQRAREREWLVCRSVFKEQKLPLPVRMNLSGFGTHVPSGLTSRKLDLVADVYLPGRNLLFLLAGAAYATQHGAGAVAIGLLDERERLFEDQSGDFLQRAEALLRTATGRVVSLRAPLLQFSKRNVLEMARQRGLRGTYSCHAGTKKPCGQCLSCRERMRAEGVSDGR